jgi:carbonic anhydrase/acetyltransferase-like protein (isoleucine patch superfamily)
MPIYSFKEFIPKIDDTNYVAPGAMVIGNVEMGEHVNIWHNCVLRGDVNKIVIGDRTNIQDLSMLHVTESSDLVIGSEVSVGHSVTLHGCKVDSHCLIGMGSTILDNAHIKECCIVAAGSVVPPGKTYPARSMIMGSPAKVTRELTEKEIDFIKKHHKSYLGYKEDFKSSSKEIDSK